MDTWNLKKKVYLTFQSFKTQYFRIVLAAALC